MSVCTILLFAIYSYFSLQLYILMCNEKQMNNADTRDLLQDIFTVCHWAPKTHYFSVVGKVHY